MLKNLEFIQTISKIDFRSTFLLFLCPMKESGPGYEATKTPTCKEEVTVITPGGEVSLHKNYYHGF